MKSSVSKILILLVLIAVAPRMQAQSGKVSPFFIHINTLADDSLEGRETGTRGELKAANYIVKEFEAMELKPAGTNGWLQEFSFLNAREPGTGTMLKTQSYKFEIEYEFFPLLYSSEGSAKGKALWAGFGICAPDLGHDDYDSLGDIRGKILVMEVGSPDGIHPHSKFKDHYELRKKIETARGKGAAAVIFINSDPNTEGPSEDFTRKITQDSIPVVFVKASEPENWEKKKVKLAVKWEEDRRTGRNVIGMIDNGAPLNVVFGAHYDHLGYGHEGSLYRGEAEIHNGADDNASGTAMLIELARSLKREGPKKFNYIFMAFSGEEKGLLGSSYFTHNPNMSLTNMNCMINFDMVGRMDFDNYTVGINGVGTSPVWSPLLESIRIDTMHIKTSESGIGPSDHTSFYLKDIPILHFFSGTHADYHKPSDDADKINYKGMADIHAYVLALVDSLAARPRLTFTKTKEADQSKAPKFSVTLGIVPDYLFDGEGVKVDGVTDGKPASAAGIKAGDIVLQLGDYPVKDMQGYMQSLAKFKKGDKTAAKVKRGAEVIMLDVQF